jgi:hypothetical protein
MTGRSITDENANGNKFETMLDQRFISRLAVRYDELSERDKQKVDSRNIPNGQKSMLRAFTIYGKLVETGKNKDELFDPSSPFNLDNVRKAVENQDREFSFIYDKDARLVGWKKGDEGSVESGFIPGSLRGGVDIHNHPVKIDRPLGLSFSPSDFVSYHKSGVALGIVYSREGEYRVTLPPSFEAYDKKALRIFSEALDIQQNMITSAMNRAIYDTMKASRNEAFMVAARMMNAKTKDFCDTLGIKFEFKPNKGYEWISSGEAVPPPKNLPDFKVVDTARPHIDNFKPERTTARGFTIGEAKDLRKPNPPKPKKEPQEPSNNNYFRL